MRASIAAARESKRGNSHPVEAAGPGHVLVTSEETRIPVRLLQFAVLRYVGHDLAGSVRYARDGMRCVKNADWWGCIGTGDGVPPSHALRHRCGSVLTAEYKIDVRLRELEQRWL